MPGRYYGDADVVTNSSGYPYVYRYTQTWYRTWSVTASGSYTHTDWKPVANDDPWSNVRCDGSAYDMCGNDNGRGQSISKTNGHNETVHPAAL